MLNGCGECSTIATSLGGSEAQADWLGARRSSYIHQMNWLNSEWLCHDDSTINVFVQCYYSEVDYLLF